MEIAFTALFILLSFYHGTISFGLLNHRQGENIAALLLEYSNLSNECNDILSVLPYAMTDSNSNDFVDICFNACLANKHCKSFTVTSTNNECFLRNCAPSQIDRQHGDEPHDDRDVRVIYYDIENKESEIRRLGSDGRSQQISMTNMPTPYQQESEIVMDSNETIIDVTEKKPTSAPSLVPTFVPTGNPTPSASPTHVPTTRFPTLYPTNNPLIRPTKTPTTRRPTTTRAPTWPDETMTPTSFPVNIRQTPYPTIKRTDGFVSPSNIPYSYSVHWEYYGGKKRPIPTNKKVCEVVMVSPGSSYRKYDNWKGNLDDCVKECTYDSGCKFSIYSPGERTCIKATDVYIIDDPTQSQTWTMSHAVAYRNTRRFRGIVPYVSGRCAGYRAERECNKDPVCGWNKGRKGINHMTDFTPGYCGRVKC